MPDQSSAATEHSILQEITAPLETLPDDPVAVVVNADFPVAMRGYDRMAVDAYVQRTSQLVAELQATRSPEAAVRRALERVGEQISGVLQRAHETAEQITAQSRSEAEDRLEQARAEATEIAAAAEQRVKDLDVDTDRIWVERHRIVDDARDLARQLLALAETAAERFPEADGEQAAAPRAEDPAGPYAEHEDETTPSDEREDETAPYAEREDETAPYAEDETEVVADDVEQTVAFRPLAPRQEHDHEPPPEPDREPPAPPRRGSSRSVIPPASQAANRRSSR
ncbi:MAG: DivIVA domain-containing protein [Solirubrobacteraceae bacterium]